MDEEQHGAWSENVFAERLRSARAAAGLSQEDVSAQMTARGFDFHQTTVGKMERALRRTTIGEAAALAQIVGRPLEELLSGSDDEYSRASVLASAERLQSDLFEWVQKGEPILDRQARLRELVEKSKPEVRQEFEQNLGWVLEFESLPAAVFELERMTDHAER